MTKFIFLHSLIVLFSSIGFAGTPISLSKGEVCEIPQDLDLGGGEDYSSRDRKNVDLLCSYDPHITKDQETKNHKAVAVCPKLNSTFPAVEFIKIKGSQAANVVKCNTKVGKKTSGKLAKFKYSMSCANTSSIVGYYHVSRALGIKYVPPVVLRTMDIDFHMSVAEQAKKWVGKDSQLISKNWRTLYSKLQNRDSAITSSDGAMSFGALSLNPRGEQKTYDGIYLGGDNQAARMSKFMTSGKSTYKKLKVRKAISEMINTELTDSNYTTIQQMKDVSDMIILDTIFGQKDRFANTHSVYTWMVVRPDKSLKKYGLKDIEKMIEKDLEENVPGIQSLFEKFERASDMPKDWRKEVGARLKALKSVVEPYLSSKGLEYAFAENLILKDNDCGLKDSNPFMKKNVIGGVYHVSPETYAQLVKLYNRVIVAGEMDEYLTKEFAMGAKDLAKFKTGLSHVAEDLMEKDERGELYKDLSVKSFFKPKPREMTSDNLPIYDVVKGGVNIRTVDVLTLGTSEASLYHINENDSGHKTTIGDKVALINIHPLSPPVGTATFYEVRVVESETLPVGQVVFMWNQAVR